MTGPTAHVDLSGLTGLCEALERSPDLAVEELLATAVQASMYLEREVKERTPVGVTNALRGSIAAKEPTTLGHRVVTQMGTANPYALPVELGTKPHFPPLQPLLDWAQHKLGLHGEEAEEAARAIQLKISWHGTKGAFMFRGAMEDGEPTIRRMYEACMIRIAERIEAGA